jgi:preprotein translocase subunit SecG
MYRGNTAQGMPKGFVAHLHNNLCAVSPKKHRLTKERGVSEMSTWEIITGIVVLVLSVLINIICLMQEQKPQSASSALAGASADMDSYYGKNQGRTKEAILAKITRTLAIIFFVVIIAMDIVIPIIEKAIS